MTIKPHVNETNPYAPLATVVDDRQLMPDESAPRTYSILWVWPAAWLTTAIAGGVFGLGLLMAARGTSVALVGFIFGTMIASVVALPVSCILYAIIAIVTRRLTSLGVMLSTGICGGISGGISSLAIANAIPLSWMVGAALVGAFIPVILVKYFFR